MTPTLDRYAYWLDRLSEADKEYARSRLVEVVAACEADRKRPLWLAMYYAWTVRAIEADDTAGELARAVESQKGDPAEVRKALAALDRTSDEWEQWWPAWHPSRN